MPPIRKTDFRSFYLLNATQFLGALNDNIFKLLVVYFLIHIQGADATNTILSLAGAIFVIPFLLFSSAAGVLADRIRKNVILVYMKLLEVVVMFCAMLAIYLQSPFFTYLLLFLMGTQSSIFGPSKYGIIPELVAPNYVSKANGSITSLTYLAVILGTFLASFITDISGKNFILASSMCGVIAIMGSLASFGIARSHPRRSTKKINPFFLYEIYHSLKLSFKRPFLFPAILGTSFFLFIGAYVQLNIIPFAMEALNLSEIGGGYLFLATAVGIVIGAKIAGKLSKDKVELGLACFSGFIIVVCFFLLSLFSRHLFLVIGILILLGIFGGMFLIPLEAFIQIASPDKRRGQIIAATNFLSFSGVLLAAFTIYLLNETWDFSAAQSFAVIGTLTFIFQSIVTGRMANHFFQYLSAAILPLFYYFETKGPTPEQKSVLLARKFSLLKIFALFYLSKKGKVVLLAKPFSVFPWLNGLMQGFKMISPSHGLSATLNRFFHKAEEYVMHDEQLLIYIDESYPIKEIKQFQKKILGLPLYEIDVEKEKRTALFQKPKISIHCTKLSSDQNA